MSGSGKSTALKAFEDMGYFCVDNLPIALLPEFLSLKENSSTLQQSSSKVSIVMDLREAGFLEHHNKVFKKIRDDGYHLEILFLDAKDDVLIRRFSQTRRAHPLKPKGDVKAGISDERESLACIKEIAHRVLDTSPLNVHQLRKVIFDAYSPRKRLDRMVLHILSFGFKHGVPADVSIVFDVRFLPNPYFVPDLRPLSGKDERVRNYVLEKKETQRFLKETENYLRFLLPGYHKEGKSFLVIGVGCTGGQHRSVAIAENLKKTFSGLGEEVILTHRDLEKETMV